MTASDYLAGLIVKVLRILANEEYALPLVVGPARQKRRGPMDLIRLTTEQEIPVDVAPKTPAGHPATIDGTPVYSIDDGAVAEIIAPGDSPTGIIVRSVGVGMTTLSGTVDADLGSGVRTIPFSVQVEIVTPEAALVDVTAGAARLKPGA